MAHGVGAQHADPAHAVDSTQSHLIIDKCLEGLRRRFGRKVQDLLQMQPLEKGEVELSRVPAAVQVVFDLCRVCFRIMQGMIVRWRHRQEPNAIGRGFWRRRSKHWGGLMETRAHRCRGPASRGRDARSSEHARKRKRQHSPGQS